jgi:type IV pilus assembly protein PilN
MIRVNLLPGKRETRRASAAAGASTGIGAGSGNGWLLGVLGAAFVTGLVCLFLYTSKSNELKGIEAKNRILQASIDGIKAQIVDHPQVKAKLKELTDREEAIDKLQAARTGPTSAMMELSHILSPGRGPTFDREKMEQIRRDSPQLLPNPAWDPRRLWLTQYQEASRDLKISGFARDGEDISEFYRRISLSEYFTDIKLLAGQKTSDPQTKIELVKFQISAKAKY